MFHYRAFGLIFSSEIELVGMTKYLGSNKSDVEIIIGEVKLPKSKADIKGPNHLKIDQDIYLWWENIGRVKIENGSKIFVDFPSVSGTSKELHILPFLLGPVIALLLYQRGYLLLHGSSFRFNESALAFLGHSKIGKSTIAFNFYQRGNQIVTDDIIAITINKKGLPLIYPAYPHVRLSKDSFRFLKETSNDLTPICEVLSKVFLDTSRGFSTHPLVLKGIYVLEKSNQTKISLLNPQECMLNLLSHSKTMISSPVTQAEDLIQLGEMIKKVFIRRLELSHSFENLPDLIKLIEEDYTIKDIS